MVTAMIVVTAGTAIWGSTARAETQAEIAARENEQGKSLMFEGNYRDASDKFRSAAKRFPDPKYYFNLCASTYQQGIYGQALVACDMADKLSSDPAFKTKVAQLEGKIRSDAAEQHVDTGPLSPNNGSGPPTTGSPTDNGAGGMPGGPSGNGTGGTPVGPAGNGTAGTPGGPGGPAGPPYGSNAPAPQYAVGRPAQNLFAAKPEHVYTWTIGADLFGGHGTMGRQDAFGSTTGGLRIKADYMLNSAAKFGSEIYFQGTGFTTGMGGVQATRTGDQTLQILDLGGGVYKHFCVSRFCVTPLGGVHFSFMNPGNDSTSSTSQTFNYVGFGARVEVALSYALGARLEHVLSLGIDANAYTRALSDPSDGYSASAWGLDRGGIVGTLGFGYMYRFNTPFGRSPFLSLE